MQRILVIRIDFLGDMVCTTPLLHALKRKWPRAEIHVLANKYNAAALDNNPDIHTIHTYVYSKQCERNTRPGRLNAVFDRLKLIWRLRRLCFDIVIIPNGGMHKNSINFARQLNVKDIRHHTEASEFDDRNSEHIRFRPMKHEALSGFALLPELERININNLNLHLYPEPQRQTQWRLKLGKQTKPRVGLFVSNNAEARRWSWEKWQRLIEMLSDNAELMIFCDPKTSLPDAERLQQLNVHCIHTPTVQDMIAATCLLDLVISADSSPVHIGAALQIPVVTLFENRPEKYLRWYPLNVPNRILREGKIVEDIPVELVYEAATRLLSRAPEQQKRLG